MIMFVAWLNFAVLNVSGALFTYIYILSVMPITREEKRGERAWNECARYRMISGFLEFVMMVNLILWIWFPIPELTWIVHENFVIGIIIGVCIAIPCLLILFKGFLDAGSETMTPSKETTMYGGIYNHIRHPHTVGEMPLFIVVAFAVNSLFLVLWATIYILITVPIIIHYEEKDLVKRFGDVYIEYQKNTGAFIPKFRKRMKYDREPSS